MSGDEPWWERNAREPLSGFALSRLRIVYREARAAASQRARAVEAMAMARKFGASYEVLAKVSGLSVDAVRALLRRPRPRFTGVDPNTCPTIEEIQGRRPRETSERAVLGVAGSQRCSPGSR
jgi:hypothetical protein